MTYFPGRRASLSMASAALPRRSPLAVAVGLALAAQVATAQEQEPVENLQEVTITGSRIQQAVGMTTPTPVAALSSADLQAMAPGSITQAMTQLPQFYASQTAENFGAGSNNFFTSPGGGSLNLRGVGSKRTLTLLDGRRVAPVSVYGGPDINMFPSRMLQRIETVTGGASAAYGTDAVSGVVNYILDTGFEGFRAEAQLGQTEIGDGDNRQYGLSVGHALGERAHILFSAEHFEQDAIESLNGRDWYQGWGLALSNAPGAGSSRDNPRLIPLVNIRATNASVDGIVSATTPASTQVPMTFYSDGSFGPLAPGSYVSTGSAAQSGGGGYDTNEDYVGLLPGNKRTTAYTYMDLDLTDNTTLYVQGMYGEQELRNVNGVGGFYNGGAFQPITIYAGNPFLGDPATPGTAASWMQQNGITSFTLGRIGSIEDFGLGHVTNDTRTVSGTAGFKTRIASGGFFDGWTIDGYAQYGRTNLDAIQEDGIRLDRIFLAADAVVDPATGRTVCRVTLVSGLVPDCVPINLFGRGNMSRAALDWVVGFDPNTPVSVVPYLPGYPPETYSYVGDEHKHRLAKITQSVFELAASGKVAEGWAGPITAAFGAHYRREAVDQKVQASQGNPTADPFIYPAWCNDGAPQQQCLDQIAAGTRPPGAIGVRGVPVGVATNSVEFQFSKVPFIRGSYDVKEVFAETIVPLISGASWLRQLNFQGAVRWADYAGSGTIWSYKGGLDAQVTRSLRLRGTYSRDVRAANIGERFDRTGGFANINDRGLTPAATYGITFVSGGNPALKPEEADTYTVGFVYRPEWLPGFDVSVDWLSVSLTDAIESLTSQQIVDACYVNGDADQCTRITRDAGTNRITFIDQQFQNLSKAKISGVDLEIGYMRAITLLGGNERIGFRTFVSWLDENSRTNSLGVKTDSVGNVPLQLNEWKATAMLNYMNGPFRWNLQARYVGDGYQSDVWNVPNAQGVVTTWDVADNEIGSVTYLDTRLGYEIPLGDGTMEIYANVNNLLDRTPPRIMTQFASGTLRADTGLGTISSYDLQGRRYAVGVSLRF